MEGVVAGAAVVVTRAGIAVSDVALDADVVAAVQFVAGEAGRAGVGTRAGVAVADVAGDAGVGRTLVTGACRTVTYSIGQAVGGGTGAAATLQLEIGGALGAHIGGVGAGHAG